MFNYVRRTLKNRKGFTLVELMVVVVIIGILASIAVPVYNASQARAEKAACQANVRMINGAVIQWQMDNNDTSTIPTLTQLGSYFQGGEAPSCPAGGSYTVPTDGNAYQCSITAHQ